MLKSSVAIREFFDELPEGDDAAENVHHIRAALLDLGAKSQLSKSPKDALEELDTAQPLMPEANSVSQPVLIGERVVNKIGRLIKKKTKKVFMSDARVESLFSLPSVKALQQHFVACNGQLTVPAFVDVCIELLRNDIGDDIVDEPHFRIELRRWAIAFAGSRLQRRGTQHLRHASAQVEPSTCTLSTKALQSRDTFERISEGLIVSWADFTSKLVNEGQQRELAEEFSHEYRTFRPSADVAAMIDEHRTAALCAMVTGSSKLFTGSKDGLVKQWSATTGAFERNAFNAGQAWITSLIPMGRCDEYIGVVCSDSTLTVIEPSTGSVIRKYAGAESLQSAPTSVVVRPTARIQRFGLPPGEYGAIQTKMPNAAAMSLRDFRERRRLEQEPSRATVIRPVPIIGFLHPTALWQVKELGCCVFGTSNGKLGVLDVTSDLQHHTRMTFKEAGPIALQSSWQPHVGQVSGIRYASRYHFILSSGVDGLLLKSDMTTGKVVTQLSASSIGSTAVVPFEPQKSVAAIEWNEKLQLLASFGVDRKVQLWSLLRPHPLHTIRCIHNPYSIAIDANKDQLISLSEDCALRIYDLRTFKCLQILEMEKSSIPHENGVVICDEPRGNLVSVFARPTIHEQTTKQTAVDPKSSHQHRKPDKTGFCHKLPVIDALYNPNSRLLYTFDAATIFVWDVVSGEGIFCFNVSKQLLPLLAQDTLLTSAAWEGKKAGCNAFDTFITGTQRSTVVRWGSLSGQGINVTAVQPPSLASQPDVTCMNTATHFNVACVSNRAYILQNAHRNDVWPYPKYIEASANVTSCKIIKQYTVVLGTFQGALEVSNLETNTFYSAPLVSREEQRCVAVESIEWANKSQCGLLICTISQGTVTVFSSIERCIVMSQQLLPRHDANLVVSAMSDGEDFFFVGDSLGRVFVLDIYALTTSLEKKMNLIAAFRAGTEPVSKIVYLPDINLIVTASLDTSVRLYKLRGNFVQHIGDFGTKAAPSTAIGTSTDQFVVPSKAAMRADPSRWDINDESTFTQIHLQNIVADAIEVSVDPEVFLPFRSPHVAESIPSASLPATAAATRDAAIEESKEESPQQTFLTDAKIGPRDSDKELNRGSHHHQQQQKQQQQLQQHVPTPPAPRIIPQPPPAGDCDPHSALQKFALRLDRIRPSGYQNGSSFADHAATAREDARPHSARAREVEETIHRYKKTADIGGSRDASNWFSTVSSKLSITPPTTVCRIPFIHIDHEVKNRKPPRFAPRPTTAREHQRRFTL